MGKLNRVAKSLKKTAYVPSNDDPRAELRRLVMEHKALVKAQTAILNMSRDKKMRDTKEIIKCRLPVDAQVELQASAKVLQGKANALESSMRKELRKLPIFTEFLEKVFGCGDVVGAYLCAMVDIHKAVKPSNLRRYCGYAVINGRLERPTKGEVLGYNAEIRMRIFQLMGAMQTNAAKKTVDAPYGNTTKYLDVWRNYKSRMQHSERVLDRKVSTKDGMVDGKIVNGQEKSVSARGFIHSTGWHKAADVFLEDLYIVWRALEGLPVWPSYYAAKLGYEHLGKISVQEPRMLTLEEALETVGHVGKVPLTAPTVVIDEPELEEELLAAE
jgi:hypothetical protein